MTSPRYSKAVALAALAHEGQVRKGTTIPYVTHPVAVAALVAQYGGDEDQQIAALLHDVLEDGGAHFASDIEAEFGPRVLAIVQGCTDGAPDATGKKAPWQQRKEAYLAHLGEAGEDVWMVSGCDKLNNARAILEDLQTVGFAVFDRFTAKREGTLWYYRSLAQLFTDAEAPICEELSAVVAQIEELANAAA